MEALSGVTDLCSPRVCFHFQVHKEILLISTFFSHIIFFWFVLVYNFIATAFAQYLLRLLITHFLFTFKTMKEYDWDLCGKSWTVVSCKAKSSCQHRDVIALFSKKSPASYIGGEVPG